VNRRPLRSWLETAFWEVPILLETKFSPVVLDKSAYRNVGKWNSEANMAPKKEPSRKVLDKHAKFLAAWEAAGFPDKFEKEGTSLNNVRSTADWYRQQKQKATKD
jgi:hypothetical protein